MVARRVRRITGPPSPRIRTNATEFKNGHAKKAGRQKGAKNRITQTLRECIREAAELCGSDGNGRGGATGYFLTIARTEPGLMVRLIEKCIPTQISGPADGPIKIMALPPEILKNATPQQLEVIEALYGQVASGLLSQVEPPIIDAEASTYAELLEGDSPSNERH